MEKVDGPERLLSAPGLRVGLDVEPNAAHPMALSMNAMVQAIHGGATAAPDFEQAWGVERILEVARRSAAERRRVRLN